MDFLIGLDTGTSNIKGVLLSTIGNIIVKEKIATELFYPQQSYVEFYAEKQYQLICQLIRTLLKNVQNGKVKAISISGASGNTVLMDENKKTIQPVISWMDERTKNSEDILDAQEVYNIVGWHWLKVFPLAHLIWLKKNKPLLYKNTTYYGMDINYLLFRLCNVFALDYSMATTFYLQEQIKFCWYKPFLNLLEIEEKSLPTLMPSGTCIGSLTPQSASETGLSTQTKVVLGAFDHPSAARGVGILDIGSLLLSCGTSWVGFFPVKNREDGLSLNLIIDPFLAKQGPWAVIFSIPRIGQIIDWYLKYLFVEDSLSDAYQKFSIESQKSNIGANGLFIDLTKNFKDEFIVKIMKKYSIEDISRAIMESAAYEMKTKLKNISIKKIVMVGGPTESFIWPQIVADITGLEIMLPMNKNGQIAGAIGAAILAGIGIGIFKDANEGFKSLNFQFQKIEPDLAKTKKYQELYQRYVLKKSNIKEMNS